MFGIIWLYDFAVTVERPTLYTGKFLMYYCVAAYFFAFTFSISSYFQDNNNFTSVNILFYLDGTLGYQFDMLCSR